MRQVFHGVDRSAQRRQRAGHGQDAQARTANCQQFVCGDSAERGALQRLIEQMARRRVDVRGVGLLTGQPIPAGGLARMPGAAAGRRAALEQRKRPDMQLAAARWIQLGVDLLADQVVLQTVAMLGLLHKAPRAESRQGRIQRCAGHLLPQITVERALKYGGRLQGRTLVRCECCEAPPEQGVEQAAIGGSGSQQ